MDDKITKKDYLKIIIDFIIMPNISIEKLADNIQYYFSNYHLLYKFNFKENNKEITLNPSQKKIDITILKENPKANLKACLEEQLNIEKGQSIRVFIYKDHKQKTYVTIYFHHITCDAVALKNCVEIIPKLYAGILPEKEIYNPKEAIDLLYFNKHKDLKYFEGFFDKDYQPIEFSYQKKKNLMGIYSKNFHLNKKQAQLFQSFCYKLKTSQFIVLSAIYSILLSKYSGQKAFIISYPVNMRPVGYRNVNGCFTNTVLMKIDLTEDFTFKDFIKSLTNQRRETKKHQNLPIAELILHLRQRGLIEDDSFMNVMISESFIQPLERIDFAGIPAKYKWRATGSLGDMNLIFENTDKLRFRLDISKKFDENLIDQFIEHFLSMLDTILENPDFNLLSQSILTPKEQKKIISQWNNTLVNLQQDKWIHQLFEEQASKKAKEIALIFESEKLSYQELNEKSNQLARKILTLLPKSLHNPIIPICSERSLEMVVGILAILKIGGAYLPIDTSWPENRINDILAEVKPEIILSQQQFTNRFASLKTLDLNSSYTDQEPCNLNLTVNAKDLAYVIYTSGSTGKAKGAMIEHHSLLNRIVWMQKEYQLNASQDRVFQKTPYTFDVSVWEFFLPLAFGIPLVIARPEGHKNPKYLIELINKQNVTVIHFVPSMFKIFLTFLKSCNTSLPLKIIILSGEAVTVDLIKEANIRLKDIPIFNLYGPTEATVDVTAAQCIINKRLNTIPIGRPIMNTACYILDNNMNPVPVGVIGELYIGGVGVGRGYLNRPDLTKERFLPNPFATEAECKNSYNTRIYKTGDLVRWLPDGSIEYIGRSDFQIKIRGLRVELEEIEATLLKHRKINHAIIIANGEAENKQLVAYYVSEMKIDITELQTFLATSLPDYMVPHFFVHLKEMPLNSNGKLDRKALPEVALQALDQNLPLQTDIEKKLAKIWAKVLKQKQISRDANFFRMGGHSLMAIKLIHELNKAFKTNYPPSFIFDHKTLLEQAAILERKPEGQSIIIPLNKSSGKNNLFLIHPGQAGAEVYKDLAKQLQKNVKAFGINSYNLQHPAQPINSIKDLASYYLKAIKEVQPKGPYNLGGWSLGGLIAFEIAQQLKDHGEQVNHLILIDSWLFADANPKLINVYLNEAKRLRGLEYQKAGLPLDAIEQRQKLADLEHEMMQAYKPKGFYSDPITLINATKMKDFKHFFEYHPYFEAKIKLLKQKANGWHAYVKNLKEVKVSATHDEIIKEPYLTEVINTLKKVYTKKEFNF